MALKSPLMPSPTAGGLSAFSPYSESPNSPAPFHNGFMGSEKRSSGHQSDSLAPPPSPYPSQFEPSPVDSNGTENTDIEEDAQDAKSPLPDTPSDIQSPDVEIASPQSAGSDRVSISKINTQVPRRRSDSNDDAPQSVIHAPEGFKVFTEEKSSRAPPVERSDNMMASPKTPEGMELDIPDKKFGPISPVNTDVPTLADRSTPRAHTKQDIDDDWKRKSRRTSSLEDIPETQDKDDIADTEPEMTEPAGIGHKSQAGAEQEVAALRTALSECWTLCNTLANLSSSHRQRTFKIAGRPQVQEQAWRSCWRMCQQLYDSRDEDHASQVMTTLELCRDFCQSLFDARQKVDEAADSVLRVSFELNNHLYNTHDRSLPDAFNERTLDFYITLCHRLMKQRTSLPLETDALLRACWSLAEMLFNLRQSNREGKNPDEELLGSAVQACWELCDLFREGWTQIRPDRGTPRPSQTTFPADIALNSSSARSENRSSSSRSTPQYHDAHSLPPETPTTIFDDSTTAASSPDSINVPNILVLGPASTGSGSHRTGTHHDRWTSNASVLSDYSESASSQKTSSTATVENEKIHLTRIRCLLLRAGMNIGFTKSSGQSLPAYINEIPATAFGSLPWQMKVLSFYKKLVIGDKSMLSVHKYNSRRLSAAEVAKSVKWLGSSEQWAWMRDLFRLVYGFGIDEVDRRVGTFSI